MNNLTPEQVSDLSDFELNKAILELLGFDVAEHIGSENGAYSNFYGEYRIVDFCNNWNDISPLACELQLDQEWSEAGLTVSYFDFEVNTFGESSFKTVKTPQRALSECAFLVLQEKAK